MPVAMMLLGAFVLAVEGCIITIIAFVIPSFLTQEMTIFAIQFFGVMGVVMIGLGWVLDKFDR